MRRTIHFILALIVISSNLCAQEPDKVDPLAPGENIYRHFTGSIGGRKVVMDLRYGYQGASNWGGSSYYFADEGGLKFFLIGQPPTTKHTETLRGQVFPENTPLSEIKDVYSIFVQTTRFEFKLSHDSLIGKWLEPNAQQQTAFVLKEDNSNGLPFLFSHGSDSAIATGKKNNPVRAVATYRGVQPSPKMKDKDATFIYNAVARFVGLAQGSKVPADLAQICAQAYLGSFRKAMQSGKEPDGSNFSGIYNLFPVYTDNGFLVLQQGGYQFDFNTNEYSDSYRYLCMDVKNKKTIALSDVLAVNNDALSALLESSFRKKYKIEPGKKITDMLMGDKMPVTDNFILVNKGLIFSYSPGRVFKDSEDIAELQEMRLFLSYAELDAMLQPEFRARLGISAKGK